MANNAEVNSGTGVVVATDEAGGAHVQLVKLVDGTEDSTARIAGDATNGLDVDLTRFPISTTATISGVAATTTNTILFGGTATRTMLTVSNDSDHTLYLKYGASATHTSYTVKMAGQSYWEAPLPIFPGEIHGRWTGTTGSGIITELKP